MKAHTNRFNWPALLLVGLVAWLLGSQTRANRPAAPASPSVVTTVDLQQLLEGLVEREASEAQLVELAEELDNRGKLQREELDVLAQDLELYPPGSKKYDETSQELAERGYKLQAYREFALRKLELTKARNLRALYEKIKKSVEAVALKQGYDIVFVDDSVVGLPTDLNESETWRQISARRTLFASPQIDVTDEIITHMNNEFQLSRGG